MKKLVERVITLMVVLALTASFFGCGVKSDEETIQGRVWKLAEVSEEAPDIFPVTTAQYFLGGESFELQFLSDGSVLIDAERSGQEYSSEAYYRYALVDGRMKIQAPLGSTRMTEYELKGKTLRITDGDNYAVFKVAG